MAKGDELATDLCRRFPDAANRTLAKRLNDEHPAIFPTIERARNAVRYCRGAIGDENRKQTKDRDTVRPLRKAGELPPLPKSEEETWEPFIIEGRKNLILSDLHVRFHSVKALRAALKFGDEWNPDSIFINGDFYDFYQLSRFEKDPTIASVASELLTGKKTLAHIRQRFPKANLYFKLGNHDERWAKYIHLVAPQLSDVEEITKGWEAASGIPQNRITVIGGKRPVMFGKLPVLHGHELTSSGSAVNPARGAFMRTHHTLLVSHSHRTSGHAESNMWHDETFVWSIGCLCGLTPAYAPVNKWNWGFAAVTVRRGGDFDVMNMRISKHGQVRAS
jgi:predicted phosphodiesterase